MVKVLRVFLILMLPLSIAAVMLELSMFRMREELRLRSSKIEAAIVSFAQKVSAAREPGIEAIDKPVDVAALAANETMDEPVAVMTEIIDTRLGQISTSRETTIKTRTELGEIRKELASNVQKRDAIRKEIAALGDVMRQKEADVARAESKVEDVNRQIAEINEQVEGQKKQVARIEDEKTAMVDERERLEEAIKEVLPPTPIPAAVARKLVGTVIRTDPEWNFVVLDIGKDHGLKRDVNMLVHRGETMVGRIKVSSVRDDVSIGHVDSTWATEFPKPGDRAFIQ